MALITTVKRGETAAPEGSGQRRSIFGTLFGTTQEKEIKAAVASAVRGDKDAVEKLKGAIDVADSALVAVAFEEAAKAFNRIAMGSIDSDNVDEVIDALEALSAVAGKSTEPYNSDSKTARTLNARVAAIVSGSAENDYFGFPDLREWCADVHFSNTSDWKFAIEKLNDGQLSKWAASLLVGSDRGRKELAGHIGQTVNPPAISLITGAEKKPLEALLSELVSSRNPKCALYALDIIEEVDSISDSVLSSAISCYENYRDETRAKAICFLAGTSKGIDYLWQKFSSIGESEDNEDKLQFVKELADLDNDDLSLVAQAWVEDKRKAAEGLFVAGMLVNPQAGLLGALDNLEGDLSDPMLAAGANWVLRQNAIRTAESAFDASEDKSELVKGISSWKPQRVIDVISYWLSTGEEKKIVCAFNILQRSSIKSGELLRLASAYAKEGEGKSIRGAASKAALAMTKKDYVFQMLHGIFEHIGARLAQDPSLSRFSMKPSTEDGPFNCSVEISLALEMNGEIIPADELKAKTGATGSAFLAMERELLGHFSKSPKLDVAHAIASTGGERYAAKLEATFGFKKKQPQT